MVNGCDFQVLPFLGVDELKSPLLELALDSVLVIFGIGLLLLRLPDLLGLPSAAFSAAAQTSSRSARSAALLGYSRLVQRIAAASALGSGPGRALGDWLFQSLTHEWLLLDVFFFDYLGQELLSGRFGIRLPRQRRDLGSVRFWFLLVSIFWVEVQRSLGDPEVL